MAAVLDFTTPHVLRNAREYKAAMAELDRLLDMDPKQGSPEADLLEFLSVLVEAYENAHEPEPTAGSPRDVVDFMLEQKAMTRGELAELMGGRSPVSDFFAGKRELSMGQVKALRDALGIPADLLVE